MFVSFISTIELRMYVFEFQTPCQNQNQSLFPLPLSHIFSSSPS